MSPPKRSSKMECLLQTLQLLSIVFLARLCCAVDDSWNVTCPGKCRCSRRISPRHQTERKTIDCTSSKLKYVPKGLPLDTEVLILKGNLIASIHEELPKLTNLVELDLSFNEISRLGQQPLFQNLTSLQYLNLDHNNLHSLLHGSFSGLLNLKELCLANNKLDDIQVHALGGLNHLVNITLSKNNLREIKNEWFSAMSSLEMLTLDNNLITNIDKESLSNLTQLQMLSLEGNRIDDIEYGAFRKLSHLMHLSVRDNLLNEIPKGAFTTFRDLKFLILDGNPVKFITAGDFEFINVREISLVRMPELLMVAGNSFTNLPTLAILHLHDNPKLMYFDGRACALVPVLSTIYLHNNNLMTLSQAMLDSIPNLKEITFYHNPIACNCNVRWIRKMIETQKNSSAHLFSNADKYVCSTPDKLVGKVLRNLNLKAIAKECPPTVLPFFNSSYQLQLGNTIKFHCRAIGVPEPDIHWILSNGHVVNGSSNYSRIRLLKGTMTIHYVKAVDGGTFNCVATNPYGFDAASTSLKIHSNNIRIIPIGIHKTFITVTWNGTDNTVSRSKYLLMYKTWDSTENYKGIHLRPYMRTYTIPNLKPKTTYEFCIAYEHDSELVHINCCNITTRNTNFMMDGIKNFSSMAIIIGLTTTIAVVMVLCFSIAAIRKYSKRKQYKEPEGANYKVDNMSQIPLDNIYNPPSTPLCSSTTSLISSSQA
ncbi:leucine-rich repeat neuronal protein 1-like [Lineus longissimus]|uniref:leucine-rich repeat neuronal protein 1-like n=1 Tax=Lineus longissimus TaxID=88925 RepID=UPI00315D0980